MDHRLPNLFTSVPIVTVEPLYCLDQRYYKQPPDPVIIFKAPIKAVNLTELD
jgi:hypothetical protein